MKAVRSCCGVRRRVLRCRRRLWRRRRRQRRGEHGRDSAETLGAQLDAEHAPPRRVRRRADRLVPRRGHRPEDHRADRRRRGAGRRTGRGRSSASAWPKGCCPRAPADPGRVDRHDPAGQRFVRSCRSRARGSPRRRTRASVRRLQRTARDRADQPARQVRWHRPGEREARRGRQRRLPRRTGGEPVRLSSGSSRAGTRCAPPTWSTRRST